MINNHLLNGFEKGNSQIGVTLIEVLVTMTIVVIIAVIALPTFTSALHNWEAKEVQNAIIQSFRLAKTQSLIQSQDVILCPANQDSLCHKDASDYLLVFSDMNANKLFDESSDRLLSKHALNLDYGHIHLRASRRNHIKFFGDTGLPRGHFGHIKYCPSNGKTTYMYQISINKQGNHRYKPYSFKATGCPE